MSTGSYASANTGRVGNWGASGIDPTRWVLLAKNGQVPSAEVWSGLVYSTGYNSNFSLSKPGLEPDGYDFIEDFSRFEHAGTATGANSSIRLSADTAGEYSLASIGTGSYVDQTSIPAAYDQTYSPGVYFIVPVLDDQEKDTIFFPNHGLRTGQTITLTTDSGTAPVLQDTATSVTSAPSFSQLSTVTNQEVSKVTNDRFRIRQAGTEKRCRSLSGNYSISSTIDNPTRNTVYYKDHGLGTGQATTIQADTGGVLPALSTTAPRPTNDGDVALAVFYATQEALNELKLSMGSSAVNLFINGTSVAQPFSQSLTVVGGGSYNFNYGMNQIAVNYADNTINELISLPTSSSWSQALPYDFMSSTSLINQGFNIIQSSYQPQQETPYWITLLEIPMGYSTNNTPVQSFPVFNSSVSGMPFSKEATNISNNTSSWATLTNGWRYTHDGIYYRPSSDAAGRHGFLKVSLILDNSNFPGYQQSYDHSIADVGPLHTTSTGFGGQRYVLDILLPIKAGASSSSFGLVSGTIANVNSLALSVASKIASNLSNGIYPSGTNPVYVKAVNSDRISLRTVQNVPLNLTNSGTAPLLFNLGISAGALDGVYPVLSTTSQSLSVQSSFKIPDRTITFSASNISRVNNILYVYSPNHSLDFGQSIVFSDPSGSFTSLTNNNTYFAVPADANYFAIAASQENVNSNVLISVQPPSVGSFLFSTKSVSGLIPRNGSITVTSNSKKVTGIGNVFFKQYFKDRDTLYVADNSTTPGVIKKIQIASVASDSELRLTEPATFSSTNTSFFTKTAVYLRPDGSFLHRPFDGGVEISAGTSPDSSIIRQTRKYFRYQSGKGIQCSIAINFNPSRLAQSVESSGTIVTVRTATVHRLTPNSIVRIRGSSSSGYNGVFSITGVTDHTFTYNVSAAPLSSIAAGVIEYGPTGWTNSCIRCGMFDEQNGFFYEYDGSVLYAVKRASVQQLSGTVAVINGSNVMTGTDTNFVGQLSIRDKIVVRGQSYVVTGVISPQTIHVQPQYRGTTQTSVIVTKTLDTKDPQSEWNLDVADGTGPSGYKVDLTKIQMAYMDYSWYGAGKIRFGFKDMRGKVRYFHEFIHNNINNEAYMRSGNLPARYQIENIGTPSYIPTLFHWGTSVIMDGKFDDDKAYLFTASSNSLSYTSGTAVAATTAAASSLVGFSTGSFGKEQTFYVKIPFNTQDASKLSATGQLFSTTLTGHQIEFTDYGNGFFNVYIFVARSRTAPISSSYPSVPSGTVVNIGSPAGGSSADLDLLKFDIPLVSIRLAPSVDNNLTGAVGQRDIINRMQLQLNQLGLTVSHDCDIKLILNGSLSNIDFKDVASPSLSELVKHDKGDLIIGGLPIFSFRASGGQPDSSGKRFSSTVDFDLSRVTDLGNSILGGDSVFPNGPDVLTIAAQIIDTSEITAAAPYRIAGRLTWVESQA